EKSSLVARSDILQNYALQPLVLLALDQLQEAARPLPDQGFLVELHSNVGALAGAPDFSWVCQDGAQLERTDGRLFSARISRIGGDRPPALMTQRRVTKFGACAGNEHDVAGADRMKHDTGPADETHLDAPVARAEGKLGVLLLDRGVH